MAKPANAEITVNIMHSLKIEVEQLRRLLAMNPEVGSTYPGQSQVEKIIALIREIELEIRK